MQRKTRTERNDRADQRHALIQQDARETAGKPKITQMRRGPRRPCVDDLALSATASEVQLDAFDGAIESFWSAIAENQVQAKRTVQNKAAERRTAQVQRAAADGVASQGGALPHLDAIQKSFGPGHDLSQIQAHVGGAAADACDDMGAHGFASGEHVAFARSPSIELAAHEAAHVVQQRSGAVQLSGGVGQVGDRWEQHADTVAARVASGRSAADLLPRGSGGGLASVQLDADGGAPAKEDAPAAPAKESAPAKDSAPAKAAAGNPDTVASAHKLSLPDVPLNSSWIPGWPIAFEVKLSADITGKGEADVKSLDKDDAAGGDKSDASGGGKTDAPKSEAGAGDAPKSDAPVAAQPERKGDGVGFSAGGKKAIGKGQGIEAELKKKFDDKWLGSLHLQPELKGAGELTTKGGKLAVSFGLETPEFGPVKFKVVPFELTILKAEKKDGALKFDFLTATTSVDATVFGKYKLDDGRTLSIEFKPKLSLTLKPEYSELGRVVIEKLAPHLRTLLTTPAGLIVAGSVAAMVGGLAFIGSQGTAGADLAAATREGGFEFRRFCVSYLAGLTGNTPMEGPAAQRGFALGQQVLTDKAAANNAPEALLAAIAKDVLANPAEEYAKIFDAKWPEFKSELLKAYKSKKDPSDKDLATLERQLDLNASVLRSLS